MTLLTDRRRFLAACSSLGLTSTLLPGVLWAMGRDSRAITPGLLASACKVAGLDVDEAHRKLMLKMFNEQRAGAQTIRAMKLPNAVAPAVIVPNGFWEDGTPVSLSFLGRLYGEAKMLAVARTYQEATGFHLRQPKL